MSWVWIVAGATVWLAIVGFTIVLCRAAASSDRALEREEQRAGRRGPERFDWRIDDDAPKLEPTGRFERKRHPLRPVRPR